ncbi:MAG: mitochondrial large ribosomal subunit protein uL15m [Candidatus Micrarchaeota archaeon]|nr:mitochondrial large ribosomal subunit protein uL15m [Candidatus Micrarchaeota archaeon]
MVLRTKKRSRKFLGSRRWGWGNIKNRRGSGSRGGVGKGNRKGMFTHRVIYDKLAVRDPGFNQWRRFQLKEASLNTVDRKARSSKEAKPTVELKGYKILSNGTLSKAVVVKASSFSKKAQEKITKAGGEAIKL